MKNDVIENINLVKKIALDINKINGKVYYVGGYVRDKILGVINKDIDIEIYNISKEQLENVLKKYGEIIYIGKSFGVYNIKGFSVDIALPRKETKKGNKHTDFDIEVDPFMETFNASKRRDFTINSIMQDVLTDEIIDHFHGIEDLKNKIIRHVNDLSFTEDPLRVLRAAQFSARFDFKVDRETIKLSQTIDITTLSKERVEMELKKALLKSNKPSIFFDVLYQMDKLDYWFIEVKKLKVIKQNIKYHPEGDVWNHTMLVLDNGSKYKEAVEDAYTFMLACLVHDFGKIIATQEIDGQIHAYNHEELGIPIIKSFLCRILNEKKVINCVLNLSKYHMLPNVLANNNSVIKKTNKMFDNVIEKKALIYLSVCDTLGKESEKISVSNEKFLLDRLDIYNNYMSKPYITGKDLIENGYVPDKNFKEILKYAHKLRLAGIKKDEALKQTLKYAAKIKRLS